MFYKFFNNEIKGKADANIQDKDGETPYHKYCQNKYFNLEGLKYLINKGSSFFYHLLIII